MELINLDKLTDKPSITRIKSLHPAIQQDVIDSVLEMNAQNLGIRITYGLRTFAEQNALYAKGRTTPGAKVTNAKGGQSYHNYGLALDFCLLHKDGKISWSLHEDLDADGIADWNEVANIFKAHGFEWGGEWNSIKDNPHVQKTFGNHWKKLLELHDHKITDEKGYVILPK